MRTHIARGTALAAACATALALAGCSTGSPSGEEETSGAASGDGAADVTLTYSLWDANQMPAYQACAAAFTEQTGIGIEFQQQGWSDYWSGLTTALVSGTAPDVITNHVAYYPELADNGQLLDIQPYVDADGFDTTQYTGELADLWIKDGKRYGLPQDWDTIALVYNVADIEAAGVDPASLDELTWNPEDGGTFGELLAHLTVDANGVRGDEDGFDQDNVETYAWALEQGGGVVGQGQWSWTALSTGFEYLDENPFGTHYNLDDQRLIDTLTWWQDQIEAGYVMPFEDAGQLGLEPQLTQHRASMVSDGSWRINTWSGSEEQDFAYAKLPTGPEGRMTIINGLAPSITAGTQHPDEAWQWVKFIGSSDCQDLVAEKAVVFPAIPEAAEKAAATHEANGVDVSAFLDEAQDPAGLAYYPITLHANEINTLAQAVIDDIQQLKVEPADALPPLSEQVNAVLGG